jgi:hypothetical protein
MTEASASEYVSFFGPSRLLVVSIHESMETWSFLHQQIFATLIVNLCPVSIPLLYCIYNDLYLMLHHDETISKTV